MPAALVVYCAFNAGGYFPDTPAIVAAALLVVLALRIAVVPRPFAGMGRGAAPAAGALGALAGWSALSMAWSHAPARALLGAVLPLTYGLALLLAATVPWRDGRLRAAVRALALACVVVCAAALASRLAPSLWPAAPNVQPERLSYPLTYWNALALLAAVGMTLCLHLVCDRGEPPAVQALAAAGFPMAAVTALLTFSRGGLASAAFALVAYAVLARPAAPARALTAVLAPSAPALVLAYRGSGGVALAVVAGALAAAALALRLPSGVSVPRRARLAVLAVAALALAAGAARQVEGFAQRPAAGSARARLTDPSSNGRTEYWRVAWTAFASAPVRGEGAGTYQLAWWRERRSTGAVTHAHSLYLETLAELGVPGLAALLAGLAAVVVGLWRRRAGPDGAAAGALLAAALAWIAHAALDWDWQMPAVTIWLWPVAGAALARARPRRQRPPLGLAARAGLGFALLAAAAGPALLAVSERRLESSQARYRAGDCDAAAAAARMAEAAFPVRPEPLALQAFCAARAGASGAALRFLDRAVARDPGDWELRYDRAVVRADGDGDPRADLAAAARLNPRAALGIQERRAGGARLYLQGLELPSLR